MWVCRAICFLFMSCVCLPSPFLLHSGLFDQFQNFGVIYQRLAAPLYRLLSGSGSGIRAQPSAARRTRDSDCAAAGPWTLRRQRLPVSPAFLLATPVAGVTLLSL